MKEWHCFTIVFFFVLEVLFFFQSYVLCIVDTAFFFCIVTKGMSLIAFLNFKNAAIRGEEGGCLQLNE